MITILPSCGILTRALIANGLSAVCANTGTESVITDFSVPGTDPFWSYYKDGTKYIEDILPVLSGANAKLVKSFLTPHGKTFALGLKKHNIEDFKVSDILYLINTLRELYGNVFIVLPDAYGRNCEDIMRVSGHLLLPFMSDAVSALNAAALAQNVSTACGGADIIAFKLETGHELKSEKITESNHYLKNFFSADFRAETEKQLLSPKYTYRDKSNTFVSALYKIAAMQAGLSSCVNSASGNGAGSFYSDTGNYKKLKDKIHSLLVEEMKESADEKDERKLKNTALKIINEIIKKLELKLPQHINSKLVKELVDDVAGLGVIEDFLSDETITEIMVNGPDSIYTEQKGRLFETDVKFPDEHSLKVVIERIVSRIGRHIDEASPIVDARLKDGSRVNAVIRPVSLNGPVLTIRKFSKNKLSFDVLAESGSISAQMTEFLKTAVLLKKNIIISGGTGTGKTTLLNAVSSFIPESERLVTIEDSAELQLQQKHVVRLESRPKSTEGSGEISIRRLLVNALRMRPDRIIVGECRAGEALDMLQAMSTGHDGSMSTVHANSAEDSVSRLSTMVMMAGGDLPESSVVSQIVSAVDVIVQLTRFPDGSRKISSISVLNKTNTGKFYEIMPVFYFKKQGIENGKQKGEFTASGYIPEFIKTASESGININTDIFK